MAVALEGFSIREYAASMRNIDLDKCWPFPAGDSGRPKSIPEISVRKFRFWYDELRSTPAAAEATNGCDNEIPSIIIRTPSKTKQRTPKKRSIVELFAVAPPVENDEEEKEDEEQEYYARKGTDLMEDVVGDAAASTKRKVNVVKEGSWKKLKTKKEKMKMMMMKKKKRLMSEKIVKKKKRKLKVEICAPKKSSTNKILSTKKSRKNSLDSRDRKKPTYTSNLPNNSSLKLLQSSKLNSMKQKGESKHHSVHSILKTPTRGTAKKAGAEKDMQRGNFINFCCESAKRVTFSGKDDILGRGKSCSTIDIPQLQNLCKIFSDVLAASSAMDNQQKGSKLSATVDETEGVTVSDMNVAADTIDTGDGTISGNDQSNDYLSHLQFLPPTYTYPNTESSSNKGRCSLPISSDHNRSSKSDSVLRALTSSAANTHLGERRMLKSIQSGQFRCLSDVQENEISLRTTDTRSVTTSTEKCSSMADTCSLSFTGNQSTSQPMSSSKLCIEENGRFAQPLAESVTDSRLRVTEFQPLSHPAATYKARYPTEDFVGLPLNSQGELIKFHSGAKFGFSESSKRQNAVQGSNLSYHHVPNYSESRNTIDHNNVLKGKFPGVTLSQADSPNWLQNHCGHVGKPVISGSGFSNPQGIQRFEAPITGQNRNFHEGSNVRQVSYHRYKEDIRTRNYIDRVNFHSEGNTNHVNQPNNQQTMRLMGKDVTVIQNNRSHHGYEDGRIWTDKEVVTDYSSPSVRVSDRPILQQQWLQKQWFAHPAPVASKDNFFKSTDASLQKFCVPAVEPKLGVMHINYQPQWISRNRVPSNSASHVTSDLFNHRFPPQSFLNESCSLSSPNSNTMTSVRMMMASSAPTTYQHGFLNPRNCQPSQGISYPSTMSNFNPPFLYQDTRDSFQPSPPHSSLSLPQWLLHAEQNRKGQGSSSSTYSDSVAFHDHCTSLSRTDVFRLPSPSPFPTSMIRFPLCTTDKSPRVPLATPVVQSSSKPIPAVNHLGVSKSKSKEGGNVNFTYLKCSSHATGENRKRPAAIDDGFMKPAKKPFLRVHEDATALASLGQNKPAEVCTPSNNKIVNENISEMVKEKEAFRTVVLTRSSIEDTDILTSSSKVSRLGPVKLSAGAKHILKLSQAANQDNSRPIHSTIPFSTANASGKLLDPQMKAAEVYRF